MRLTNLSLKVKIKGITILLLVIIFVGLGTSIFIIQKRDIVKEVDERMQLHLKDLYSILDNHQKLKQDAVNISLHLAHTLFYNAGIFQETDSIISVKGINQVTKAEKQYAIHTWKINNSPVYNNFSLVDEIKEKSVESATIFQKIEDGYLRISTNVMKLDGTRAVGTFIPNSSDVIKTIERGETFYGRAFVVNDWYLTAYEPIKVNGAIKGILYVGVKEKNSSFLAEVFNSKTYFSSGYPYLVNMQGDILIHPTLKDVNLSEYGFFQDMKNAGANEYKSDYLWEGRKKIQYFKYFEPYDSYISVTVYKSDIYQSVRKLLIVLTIGIIISSVLLFAGLTLTLNPVISGIKSINRFAQAMAKGNLTNSIAINREDEIGQTSKALNDMILKVRQIIEQTTNTSYRVANIAQQLNAGAETVSQSASEQATSIEEISASIEELTASINQNTENAKEAREVSEDSNNGMKQVSEKAIESVEANKRIANKITIINDISFQTNILALNAAVEAARAGKHGKGFAVVAAEVRKLAENSKVAADEIVQFAQDSLLLADGAGHVMHEALPKIENTLILIDEIAAASQEQTMGTSQINNAVNQINESTQQNANIAEEVANTSENLSKEANEMVEALSFFTIEKDKPQLQLLKTAQKVHLNTSNAKLISKQNTLLEKEDYKAC